MYLCSGEIDAGEFSLRITADGLDPDRITRLLGLQPTSTHRRGDTFGKRGHSYKFGQWTFSTERLDFRNGKCVWMRTRNRDYDISAFALGELARRKLRLHFDTYLESDDED